MSDKINFTINKKSKYKYRLRVFNKKFSGNLSRGWIYVYAPDGKKVINNPVQTYFVFKKGKFVKEKYDDLYKKRLTLIKKSDIYKLFKVYGF